MLLVSCFITMTPPCGVDGYPIEVRSPADGTGYEIGACALVRNAPAGARKRPYLYRLADLFPRRGVLYRSQKLSAFRQTAPPAQQMDCRRWTRSSSSPTIWSGQAEPHAADFVLFDTARICAGSGRTAAVFAKFCVLTLASVPCASSVRVPKFHGNTSSTATGLRTQIYSKSLLFNYADCLNLKGLT